MQLLGGCRRSVLSSARAGMAESARTPPFSFRGCVSLVPNGRYFPKASKFQCTLPTGYRATTAACESLRSSRFGARQSLTMDPEEWVIEPGSFGCSPCWRSRAANSSGRTGVLK